MASTETKANLFDQLVDRHRSAVYGYLRARVTDDSQAEFLTRSVFKQMYRERRQFHRGQDEQEVRNWLLDTARDFLKLLVRSGSKQNDYGWTSLCLELEDNSPLPATVSDANITRRLENLDPNLREAITLTYVGRQSPKQIGERLRRSEAAVRQLISQAKALLRSPESKNSALDESTMREEEQ